MEDSLATIVIEMLNTSHANLQRFG